ncbi:hypothetical protein Tco_0890900 [Tanacetum coccineum]|uniref:Uncharacterized protein n=1 Tax=Tanacetum coccineum TaxID=301880 RepID=A0ABQ5C2Y4_9ASTR
MVSDDGGARKATGGYLRKVFRSRLTPGKNTRYSSELHGTRTVQEQCSDTIPRTLVLGQPQDEANSSVSYILEPEGL